MRVSFVPVVLGLVVSAVAACSALTGDDTGSSTDAISIAGRWRLPAAVAEKGATMSLHYDGAPNWSSRNCGGKLLPGAMRLGEYLQSQYKAITSVGGYSCRRNTADSRKMSVHGTGRALDIFIPMFHGAADNSKGDPLANWLVQNSERIGVQLIIWDHTVWQANGRNDKQYSGPIPHIDHLHVELTIPAAAMRTEFFQQTDAGGIVFDDAGIEGDAAATDPNDGDAGVDTDPNDPGDPDPNDPDPDDPTPDVPPDPTAPTDAGAAPNDTTPPSTGSDASAPTTQPPATGTSTNTTQPEPEGEEPAEGESTGTPTHHASPSSDDSAPPASSGGCSTTPVHSSSSDFLAPLALVVAASLVRRRRR